MTRVRMFGVGLAVIAAAVSACSGGSSTHPAVAGDHSGAATAVATPAAATSAAAGASDSVSATQADQPPTSHYVLLCNAGTGGSGLLTWLDSSSYAVVYQQQISTPPFSDIVSPVPAGQGYNQSGFTPTPLWVADQLGSLSYRTFGQGCGTWQVGADGHTIAGIDTSNGSSVPARFDLQTGTTTDIVPQPDTTGYAATSPLTFFAAYYDPMGVGVWSLECDLSNDTLTVHRADGSLASRARVDDTDDPAYGGGGDSLCGSNARASYLLWPSGAGPTPTLFAGSDASVMGQYATGPGGDSPPYGVAAVPPAPGVRPKILTAAQAARVPLLDPSGLPRSNYVPGYARRSPDGTQAVFVAQNQNSHAWALFRVDGAGKTVPQQVSDLPWCTDTCADVLAYSP